LFGDAVQCHSEGRLAEAEQLYRHILAVDPRHADSLHRLGVIAYQQGRHVLAAELLGKAITQDTKAASYHAHFGLALDALGRAEEAVASCRTAIALEPDLPDTHNNLGVMLMRSGRLEEAADCYGRAIALQPRLPEAHNNLGNVLLELGRPQEAAVCYRNVLALVPDFAEAYANLGNALLDQNLIDEAIIQCRRAIELAPGFADAHNNLGSALWRLGRMDEAASCYRTAIGLSPEFAKAHANLGGVLKSTGQLTDAIACFQRALQIDPGQAEIWNNLALAFMAFGDSVAAMKAITRSLNVRETPENRRSFVHCAKDLRFEKEAGELRPLLLRALREGWDRPDDLARVGADLVKHHPDIAPLVRGARLARSEHELLADGGVAALAGDDLLQAILCRAPNLDIELERLLMMARRELLRTAMNPAIPESENDSSLEFPSALAQQCFINDYVFYHSDDEIEQARILRDCLVAALESGAVRPSWIAAVAAYFPLSSVPHSRRLLDTSWPPAIEAILTQQIREPGEEARLRSSIPQLTEIEDSVSRSVQAQYEENPYPRWVEAGTAAPPEGLATHLRQKFPFASVEGVGPEIEILVAGCGTGRNAIETAQRFKYARMLAIDLSLNSLGYAARKSQGRVPIEYAQADLAELGSMDRRFDLIEAVGVLHHLAEPFAGWRVLLSLLKPGGVMMVGLYSAAARRDLPDMRARGAVEGITAHDVRQARQRLMQDDQYPQLALHPDFFSISTCRDLLFHVQEHPVSLAAIDGFLRSNGLKFIGFSLDDAVLAAYRRRFSDDPGATDLNHWQEFETDNPDTFSGMYQFWLQRAL
jgi:tetratricopeptide (TPR) repeat protein/SAM-dependent methyltransferase